MPIVFKVKLSSSLYMYRVNQNLWKVEGEESVSVASN
jgi:hypothetical protein